MNAETELGAVARARGREDKHSGAQRQVDSLLLSGDDGERRRSVGHEGWRSTEAPRRAFTRCTSRALAAVRPAGHTRACVAACAYACGGGVRANALAQLPLRRQGS